MSLVIGYIDPDGNRYMIADSCGYGGLTKAQYANRKLFNAGSRGSSDKADGVFVGMTGSFKLQNLITINLRPLSGIKSVRKGVLGNVVPWLTEELDAEAMDLSSMLIMFKDNAAKSRMVYIQGDYSVLEPAKTEYGVWKSIGAHGIAADIAMDIVFGGAECTDCECKHEIFRVRDPETGSAVPGLLQVMGAVSARCDAVGVPYYVITPDGQTRKHANADDLEGTLVKGGW